LRFKPNRFFLYFFFLENVTRDNGVMWCDGAAIATP